MDIKRDHIFNTKSTEYALTILAAAAGPVAYGEI